MHFSAFHFRRQNATKTGPAIYHFLFVPYTYTQLNNKYTAEPLISWILVYEGKVRFSYVAIAHVRLMARMQATYARTNL